MSANDKLCILIVCVTAACVVIDLLYRRYGHHRSLHAPEWEQHVADWQGLIIESIKLKRPDSAITELIALRDQAIANLRRHDRESADQVRR